MAERFGRRPRGKARCAAYRQAAGRPLGDVKFFSGIGELRIDYGPGYRIHFVQRGRVLIILLCGGDKSSQRRDINKAIAMAKEV